MGPIRCGIVSTVNFYTGWYLLDDTGYITILVRPKCQWRNWRRVQWAAVAGAVASGCSAAGKGDKKLTKIF